jgi:ribosomal protein S18 acetylase RimI-like enzyme
VTPRGTTMITIERAQIADLDSLVPLFEAYREFYRVPLDGQAARRYLHDRLKRSESTVFLAWLDAAGASSRRAVGFTQLYPTCASLRLAAAWVLYDLYVAAEARRLGVARQLMDRALEHARASGAAVVVLETAVDNRAAQALYESTGWKRDTEFYTYYYDL